MAYGTANVDNIQSSTAGTPVVFKDGGGTQIGTLCRAWVNFNGTGTVAIRASFNVSSITDNGTGDYTINFTTALTDANYAFTAGYKQNTAGSFVNSIAETSGSTRTSSAIRIACVAVTGSGGANGPFDVSDVDVAIFR
jgi:hypothetical protein